MSIETIFMILLAILSTMWYLSSLYILATFNNPKRSLHIAEKVFVTATTAIGAICLIGVALVVLRKL